MVIESGSLWRYVVAGKATGKCHVSLLSLLRMLEVSKSLILLMKAMQVHTHKQTDLLTTPHAQN